MKAKTNIEIFSPSGDPFWRPRDSDARAAPSPPWHPTEALSRASPVQVAVRRGARPTSSVLRVMHDFQAVISCKGNLLFIHFIKEVPNVSRVRELNVRCSVLIWSFCEEEFVSNALNLLLMKILRCLKRWIAFFYFSKICHSGNVLNDCKSNFEFSEGNFPPKMNYLLVITTYCIVLSICDKHHLVLL